MHPSKRRGDRAELEVEGMVRDHLGIWVRRALGAGRKDDVGDIHGLRDTVIQVANRKDVANAVRNKPLEAERQRITADVPFAASFIRLRGGRAEDITDRYRVVLTPEQWFALWREAQ